ncbi:uncharacterized protein V6R79_024253 [Siganus canaliculatus]
MSSPIQADEDEVDEVEFVSEGPARPVLECIDLRSDSEDEGCSSMAATLEEKISSHKARVTSTLDRLAQQVAREKVERANKCRAFKEKQTLQKAHGQQELAFSVTNGSNQEAKRCVDMWLKMPGVKPGSFSAGFRKRRHESTSFPTTTSTTRTCPVINCGRVFDNASLLEGHLKRFDHSPCDPTINLKGCPSELFACAACGCNFPTKEAWRKHQESKVSSSAAGHSISQTYQRIVCFACPACYFFFNLRDECLQHMSAKNHFTECFTMNETKGQALPIPIPQYVKNRLITLCKEVAFGVRCSLCHKVLTSHQAAQAHFNVHCRQGCAVANADKTVAEVMKQLQVRGQCSLCSKVFLSQAEIERHKESTQHHVEVNKTMQKAVLQHRRFSEIQHTQSAREAQLGRRSTALEIPLQKRNQERGSCEEFPSKRKRMSLDLNGSTGRDSTTAWYCECGQQFSEEAAASKHLLAVNQIFHQCGVCGKHMGESSITRLHMSRFHGGAHLSNFLFYCRKCKVEMPRYVDILSHVSQDHSGHTFFTEREVPVELATVLDAKPSTSSYALKSAVQQVTVDTSSSKVERSWMCRMCEDVFDAEEDVRKHCSDINSHSYQRFVCGHCPQKFFKESTVRRHCVNEHNGDLKSSYFCGLCDSMQFESEGEFLEHYKSLHSKDYYCVEGEEVNQPAITENPSPPTCSCMGSVKSTKAAYTQCMRRLADEGKCLYVCAPCGVSVPSYAQIKTHVHMKHTALKLDKTFDVECKSCQESFKGVPSFHEHYHSQHCTLEPCRSSTTTSFKGTKAEPTAVQILSAVEIKPDCSEMEDETLAKFLNAHPDNSEHEAREDESDVDMSVSAEEAREAAELEEALKRSLLDF